LSAIGAAGTIDLGPGLPDLGGFDLGGFDNIPLSENGQPPAWKYVQASVFQGLASQASPGVDNGTLMVQMSNVPNNPARAVAYQMQKRLDLQVRYYRHCRHAPNSPGTRGGHWPSEILSRNPNARLRENDRPHNLKFIGLAQNLGQL
jgi:hypothetical protein